MTVPGVARAALIAVSFVVLSGCAATDPGPAATGSEPPAAAVEALDFSAPAVGGGTVDGADYAGRDVVLWLWAPW